MKYKKKIENTKFNRLVELNFIHWSQACFFVLVRKNILCWSFSWGGMSTCRGFFQGLVGGPILGFIS